MSEHVPLHDDTPRVVAEATRLLDALRPGYGTYLGRGVSVEWLPANQAWAILWGIATVIGIEADKAALKDRVLALFTREPKKVTDEEE